MTKWEILEIIEKTNQSQRLPGFGCWKWGRKGAVMGSNYANSPSQLLISVYISKGHPESVVMLWRANEDVSKACGSDELTAGKSICSALNDLPSVHGQWI